jgi:4-diphosphocytidyl-2-C-methyl-D-erythritol kinase
MKSLELKANAKINLALAVKYKRDDGYHEVELIFQEIDFHDRIFLSKCDSIKFSTDSPILQDESSNLCVIAANLLVNEYNLPGLEINLEKNLPIGAGLGGGSSNAAAVLRGGLKLYGIDYSHDSLVKMATSIGADVPFFLIGGTAYGSGKGEILKSITLNSDYFILLVLPEISISTEWAYKNLNLTLTKKNDEHKFRGFRFQELDLLEFRSEFYNEFENVVFKQCPDLFLVKSELYDQGAVFASLSGSGSVLYGLFSSRSKVDKAREILSRKYRCQLSRPIIEN